MKRIQYEDLTDEEIFYLMCRQRASEKVTSCRRQLQSDHDSFNRQQMLRQQQEAAIAAAFLHQRINPP